MNIGMKRTALMSAVLVATGFCAQVSAAENEWAGVPIGPLTAYPGVGLDIIHDDNVFTTSSNEKSSWITVLKPVFLLEAKKRDQVFSLSYKGAIGFYDSTPGDDYDDHNFRAEADMQISSRSALNVSAGYKLGHDPRGSNDRPISNSPDKWHASDIGGVFAYGSEGAKGKVELEGQYTEKRYDNNRVFTRGFDRDDTTGGATFYWKVMPKTSLLLQAKNTDIDYTLGTSTQDNDNYWYMAGVTWDATAKTSGTVKVGYTEKDFDSSTREDQDGIGWQAEVQWKPLTRSTVDFGFSRGFNESTGIGDTTETTDYSAAWSHDWTSRTSTGVNLSYIEDEYQGGSTREDETFGLSLNASYQFRRWLGVNAVYNYTDRDSNTSNQEYDRNQFMLNFLLTL